MILVTWRYDCIIEISSNYNWMIYRFEGGCRGIYGFAPVSTSLGGRCAPGSGIPRKRPPSSSVAVKETSAKLRCPLEGKVKLVIFFIYSESSFYNVWKDWRCPSCNRRWIRSMSGNKLRWETTLHCLWPTPWNRRPTVFAYASLHPFPSLEN